ncbi:MAG TPA: DUF3795 domain-containing protein [Anaerolineales bacterium]|nr:DUF3795 domain-containing protein [Anaerolineales bacterium]
MTTLISACGLDCAQCEAYQATQSNDILALEAVVEKWTQEYHAPGITVENVQCDGCTTAGRKTGHCYECKIRLCAIERGFENCAACPDYACEQLLAFFQMVPQAKANLDAIHAA